MWITQLPIAMKGVNLNGFDKLISSALYCKSFPASCLIIITILSSRLFRIFIKWKLAFYFTVQGHCCCNSYTAFSVFSQCQRDCYWKARDCLWPPQCRGRHRELDHLYLQEQITAINMQVSVFQEYVLTVSIHTNFESRTLVGQYMS